MDTSRIEPRDAAGEVGLASARSGRGRTPRSARGDLEVGIRQMQRIDAQSRRDRLTSTRCRPATGSGQCAVRGIRRETPARHCSTTTSASPPRGRVARCRSVVRSPASRPLASARWPAARRSTVRRTSPSPSSSATRGSAPSQCSENSDSRPLGCVAFYRVAQRTTERKVDGDSRQARQVDARTLEFELRRALPIRCACSDRSGRAAGNCAPLAITKVTSSAPPPARRCASSPQRFCVTRP